MKYFSVLIILALGLHANAQHFETKNVKTKIIEFFDSFHKQDTTAMRSMVTNNLKLQSISTNKKEESVLTETSFNKFLEGIASIPNDQTFEEKLLDFNIQIDGKMANVWTPYEFWYQGNFSHCGVNSFQLIKQSNEWKIFYLVDTRRKEECHKNSKN
jgi:hypothetical protein